MIAVVPEPGIPSASSGTILPPALALLAASGPATPSIAPFPNSEGFFEAFRSVLYDRKVETVAPAPGRTPTKNPIRDPRIHAGHDRRHSSAVIRSPPRVDTVASDLSRLAAAHKTSPMAKKPIAATTMS